MAPTLSNLSSMIDFNIASRGTRPKKGATRRAPAPPKQKASLWQWGLIAIIVGGFGFGLSQLSQVETPSTNTPTAKAPPPVVKKEPQAAVKTTPKKDDSDAQTAPPPAKEKKEKFEFYQILQNSEVDTSHVDAYQSTPRGEQDFYYMIQAASFRSPDDADRMRAKLILSGLEAAIRQTTGSDGRPWYRVVLGPYESRSKMNRAQDKLVSLDIQSYTYKVKKEQ